MESTYSLGTDLIFQAIQNIRTNLIGQDNPLAKRYPVWKVDLPKATLKEHIQLSISRSFLDLGIIICCIWLCLTPFPGFILSSDTSLTNNLLLHIHGRNNYPLNEIICVPSQNLSVLLFWSLLSSLREAELSLWYSEGFHCFPEVASHLLCGSLPSLHAQLKRCYVLSFLPFLLLGSCQDLQQACLMVFLLNSDKLSSNFPWACS